MSQYNNQRQGTASGQTKDQGLVLQKQLPSSQIPRFNPHGHQPEPVPKKQEKSYENYSPVKRQFGKSKESSDINPEDYKEIKIDTLLFSMGVDFRKPNKEDSGWLPLEAYDDSEFDTRVPIDWLKRKGSIPKEGIGAQGLWKDTDKMQYWRKLRVLKYLPKSERYEAYWENTKERCRLHRIYIVFDDEDPRIFARRFKQAIQNRIYADALIKYSYYIQNMPKHQIPDIDPYQTNRILELTQTTKNLRGKSSNETIKYLNEINQDFCKTMNKIIFDKHLEAKGNNLITGQLCLPPKKPRKETPYLGMITIPAFNFPKALSKINKNSIQGKDEVVIAQQEIRKECNEIALQDIYNVNFAKTQSVSDFKKVQESSILRMSFQLRETWINKLRDIIKSNFSEVQDSTGKVKKQWFNLTETNKEAYEISKLKRFLVQQKLVMQDTILQMTKSSLQRFVDAILYFIPISVQIQDSNTVHNNYYTKEEEKNMGAKKEKMPLFSIDLCLVGNGPQYSTSPEEVVKTIRDIFKHGLGALQEKEQLEQKLMPHFFKSNQKAFLKVPLLPEERPKMPDNSSGKRELPDENIWVYDQYERLCTEIQKSVEPLHQYIATYSKYKLEFMWDPEAEINKIKDEENWPTADELEKEVKRHRNEAQRLNKEIPEQMNISFFKVNCKTIRDSLSDKHTKIANEMIEIISKMAKSKAQKIMHEFDKINVQIETQPSDIEELSRIRETMQSAPNDIAKLQQEITSNIRIYEILENFQYQFGDEEDYDKRWRLFGSPKETFDRMNKQGDNLEKEKEKFVALMKNEQSDFDQRNTELSTLVASFDRYTDETNYEEIAAQAKNIMHRLNQSQEQAKKYNMQEQLTGENESNYEMLKSTVQDFQPFFELWTTYETWENSQKSWKTDDFEKLDAALLEETVDNAKKLCAKCIKNFRAKDQIAMLKIGEAMRDKVQDFQPHVQYIMALRTDGMKDRHWDAISEKVGQAVKPYPGFTMKHVLDMNLIKFEDDIVDIGEKAAKQYQIECQLAKMKNDWEEVVFNLKPFKKTTTYTIVSYEEPSLLLDDHMVLTQTMQFSSFRGPFEEEIEEWNASLLYVTNVIEEWNRCQKDWMYLQPIFDSPDIMKQLPAESKRFKAVDKNWREIIQNTKSTPQVLRTCLRDERTLLGRFKECNENLDKVQKGLKEYLESKCKEFARFYFLADADLLEILSQTKEVENVRPHLKKVFENMNDLEFNHDKTISAMMSGENEKVNFLRKIDPKDRKVEEWMGEVENMMLMSVRDCMKYSISDYLDIPRTDWVLKHPGMCVLNGSQAHWTANLETYAQEGISGVKKFLELLNKELMDTVNLVRQRLTVLQSITLGALIVIDVHARDVIQMLIDTNISSISDFEWISQLRYYWEENNLYVKCIQTNFPYGYEYLGNSGRLVITKLTDKCYMTLMGALKLNLGGAPAGPAGTGKTESTKDLAKALAKQCVVFNCSADMEHTMIAKFFKGLSAAGSWICFDEFNRINIEVLSVIAQQLQTLFKAKAENRDSLMFEDTFVKMKPTFCVFITMNPGYAGRTELPDNLKALFRPVAMMVPDYAVIAQIKLYSFGYQTATELSNKMVTTFTLSSEQLSSQDHYDYGMRAVSSVINTAGLLKRETPDMAEDQLLLRALRDVNVPKFLKDDLPLFENIIKDLFPTTERPKIDYGKLMQAIVQACGDAKLQPIQSFREKVIQLYDTTRVRHGLMLVGPTGGGKTANYQTLAAALCLMAKNDEPDFEKVNYHVLNPKSITMGQLYGYLDSGSGEWVDGVAALMVNQCAKDQNPEKHWVMFDGPVDALWIESMNTVLDDNKKLCLNSGQIIPLSKRMVMMFEVEDLAVASPATVSRCGMVYMEPGSIGNMPVVKSWMARFPDAFLKRKSFVPMLEKLIEKYMEGIIPFVRKQCPEPVKTVDNNLAGSFMRLMDCFFAKYQPTETKPVCSNEEMDDLESMLEPLVLFALTWSAGATTTMEGRKKFDSKLKELMGKENRFKYPENGSCYNYMFKQDSKEWLNWTLLNTTPFAIDQKLAYAEIIVPTFDSIRYKYVKKMLLENRKHVLCPGPTGTGKTVNISSLLNQEMPEEFSAIPIMFSAQTSANQTQDTLDEKFEKRRKGVFGPPTGKKFVLFIDDLNMPKKEEYGAQPPIELIRQWMDHGGWYDLKTKEKEFKEIVDIIFCSAMGPPGGGRSSLTQRLQRHYNILNYTNLGAESIEAIFKTILNRFLGQASQEISDSVNKIVDATRYVYDKVEQTLKPTPNKSHYTFNLRDMSKIFQGVCAANFKTCNDKLGIVKLWVHENQRVFGDRMINDDDKNTLLQLLLDQSQSKFNLTDKEIFTSERIIFGDFMFGNEANDRPYDLIQDMNQFQKRISDYLEDMNAGAKHSMKLVMFLDACEHVARICRILRQPLGNGLLLGVGGSGRQSLTRLATYISNYRQFQIEVVKGYTMRDWRDNVKTVLMQAGIENKATTFIFVDTQIINEQMLEDINNILNSGEIAGLYRAEDLDPIYQVGKAECTRKGLIPNKMNFMACYVQRVKQNIHMVIAMSPLGEIFRERLRKFPSLVNCCTIDWFTNWPGEALLSVGNGFVRDNDMNLNEKDQECVVKMFKIIHQSVEVKVKDFANEFRRINYVTPTSFLELLSMYKKILNEKRSENDFARMRLSKGLDVLKQAAIEIDEMQKQLEASKPVLEQTTIQITETALVIEKESKEANEIKAVATIDEENASKVAAEVKGISDQANAKLAEAEPALEKAVRAVKEIKVADFFEMKTVNTPGPSIVTCFKMLCLFLTNLVQGQKPKKPNDEKKLASDPEGYWDLSRKTVLAAPQKLLEELINYDKDHIPDELIFKVTPMLNLPEMDEAKVKSASSALVSVRIWITAMIKYHNTLKEVTPLRAIAKSKGEELAAVMAVVAVKRAQVKAINDKLAALSAEEQRLKDKKKELTDQMEDCAKKLVRADAMISGLQGEKVRWTETVQDLTFKQGMIVGDCLVAAGMVSYAGPFSAQYREALERLWRENLDKLSMRISPNVTMRSVIGNDLKIREWSVNGLPSDNLSVENGIIMFVSRRWPLMIDPQTQANKFIKKMGKSFPEKQLDVCKLSASNLMRNIEMGVTFGKWILLENIGTEIDPSLEPILLQQKIRQGKGYVIKIGEKTLQYNEDFKFFMTTTLPNPHYSPETSVKVTILNFSITPIGLEDQMLNLLVLQELPELQEKKNQIVEENAKSAKILYDIEDSLLEALSSKSVAQLLDNDDLIEKLAASKTTSTEIAKNQAESKITEKEIDSTRESFRPVAYRASLLFFCIVDLNIIDPMYQYSLQWFQGLFCMGVNNSRDADVTDNASIDRPYRIKQLNDYFSLYVYRNVCRSLFERHKLLFSFLLCTKILFGDNEIDMQEWRLFLAGPQGEINVEDNPTDWLQDVEWSNVYKQLYTMDQLDAFKGITDYFKSFHKKFKKIFDSEKPHEENLPGDWNARLNSFQKLLILKAIRPDKIPLALQNFIIEKVGKQFIEPPVFQLSACYDDSSQITPLVFVLSTGSDPVSQFNSFCEKMGMAGERSQKISLGSGQDKRATNLITDGLIKGQWVLLQNCHLMISWMPKLEQIVEQINMQAHADFRLWLTSSPSAQFPVSILQNAVKMTMEPPTGLKANLMQTYENTNARELNDSAKPKEFKKLLFALSYFHAIIQDRRKFGSIGWNIRYEFSAEDFDVCKKQLKIFLDIQETIPYKVLNFVFAQINYGGRVTDYIDVRLMDNIIQSYIKPDVLTDSFKFSGSGIYRSIEAGSYDDYVAYIKALPQNPEPEAFGLHDNAEITTNQNETRTILENVLSIQPRASSGGGKSREELIGELAQALEAKTPPAFDIDEIQQKYQTDYNESMNTVLAQEVIRYNRLLVIMAQMLKDVQKALVGDVVMSEALDKMANSLFNNLVPDAWSAVGFLSLKPLASWVIDMLQRIKFLQDWIDKGPPPTYWVSGFFFPQAFFTGTKQNYARKHKIAIDELTFDFKILDDMLPQQFTEKPEDGCYCWGMYMEGARWDDQSHSMADSNPKQLYTEVPLVWFLPKRNRKKPETGIYMCPVYKVLSRAGTLSTTGHSTNFCLWMELPSNEEERKWIVAGVAAFLALRY